MEIKVMVCGLKNLVVQNEESLQDVNAPIFPFGVRPKVEAEFYIGNKELFGKNWQSFWICADWKNKPQMFAEYYADYDLVMQDGVLKKIDETSFKFKSALLEEHK